MLAWLVSRPSMADPAVSSTMVALVMLCGSLWLTLGVLFLAYGAASRQRSTTAGQPTPGIDARLPAWVDFAAYALSSVFFWVAAANTVWRVAAAFGSCPTWRQLPAALLLNSATLPFTVLLALSLEPWFFQSSLDTLVSQGGLSLLLDIHDNLLPELVTAGWWPLEMTRACLELGVAAVRDASLCRALLHSAVRSCFLLTSLVTALCAVNPACHQGAPSPCLSNSAAVWPVTRPPCRPAAAGGAILLRLQERQHALVPARTHMQAARQEAAMHSLESMRRSRLSTAISYTCAPFFMVAGE